MTKQTKKIEPVKTAHFQTAEHRYRRHDCVVPSGTKKEDLENPDLWVNVAPLLNKGVAFDEVRVMAQDETFIAYLVVTFSQGSDARLKLMSFHELAAADEIELPQGKYDVKLCGTKKFVVYNTETGEFIKENIPTKAKAYQELEDYVRALRS